MEPTIDHDLEMPNSYFLWCNLVMQMLFGPEREVEPDMQFDTVTDT